MTHRCIFWSLRMFYECNRIFLCVFVEENVEKKKIYGRKSKIIFINGCYIYRDHLSSVKEKYLLGNTDFIFIPYNDRILTLYVLWFLVNNVVWGPQSLTFQYFESQSRLWIIYHFSEGWVHIFVLRTNGYIGSSSGRK